MKSKLLVFSFVMSLASSHAMALKTGDAAPAFSVTGADGTVHQLKDFKDKYVVLEWHNKDCPFVKKHYGSGNMQKLQKKWTDKGVTWLAVISSAPGKQGYETATDANKEMKENHASPTMTLLDSRGEMGLAYGAKTTPHMFVIDPHGVVIYNGAIDDKPTPDKADVTVAKNYVDQALVESMAGKKVTTASSTPYGCGIKYGETKREVGSTGANNP